MSTTDTDTVIVDFSQAKSFIETLFLPTDTILIRPIESWTEDNKKRSWTDYSSTFYPTQATMTKDSSCFDMLVERSEKKHTNLFFGVCPRVGGESRKTYDLAWQIRTVRCLYSDVDHCTPAEVASRCVNANLPDPSITVSSGNGVHLYWLLADPYIIDDAGPVVPVLTEFVNIDEKKKPIPYYFHPETKERINLKDPKTGRSLKQNAPKLSDKAQLVQRIIANMAATIGGDHTQDLTRLLRLPGTLNRKDERNGRQPVPCTLISIDSSRRYTLTDFERFNRVDEKQNGKHKKRKVEGTQAPGTLLDKLIEACNSAEDRSKADFALCAESIRRGWDQELVWQRVQNVGKFADRGREYFESTWEHAAARTDRDDGLPLGTVTNGKEMEDENGKKFVIPLSMDEVIQRTRQQTDDWPRRVDNALFVHDRQHGLAWLEKPQSLYGWLHRRVGRVTWFSGKSEVGKQEFYAELQRTAPKYRAVEELPHEPMMPGHYYANQPIEPGDGSKLRELLERFNPSTQIDADLILSAFLTPLWGGPAGTRPCFVITSDDGRGAGKSTLAEMIGALFGGVLQFTQQEDIKDVKTRLLSPEALTRRVCLLDNVKSMRFSWAELEGLITATTIGGRRMYVGEAVRPNSLTWFITLNGASLSCDMAQRAIVIKINKPPRSATWEEDTRRFVADHQRQIVGDLIGVLRGPVYPLSRFTRWATWERDILQRLPEPGDAQRVVMERQSVVDVDHEEASVIEDFFHTQLERLDYRPDVEKIHIPSQVAARWYGWATNEKSSVISACRHLSQLATEGRLPRLDAAKGRNSRGRGFVWIGPEADIVTSIWTDLESRISQSRESA